MRRWNGWGDDSVDYPVTPGALGWLREQVGEPAPPQEVPFERALQSVPEPALPAHPLISTDPADRLRHARGQSLPDWVELRAGRVRTFPAGVAHPESEEDIRALFAYAREQGVALIPYGGGTSVVGHINPEPGARPAVTVDLSHLSRLESLDEASRLATFGAGVSGPLLEAALRAQGYTLGHFPQSFEASTLGGWVATRSSGQQSLYYGRIEDLFAGGRMIAPAGVLDMPPHPASAAGPDLRQAVLGSEGRLGIITRATVRVSPLPGAEAFDGIFFPTWEQGVEAVRAMVQARLPLSMLRLSNAAETEANLTLAGHERLVGLAQRGLGLLGHGRGEKCMLVVGATGRPGDVRRARRGAAAIARQHGGLPTGEYIGKTWRKSRFLTPYLRNTLWEAGYAIDTLETIVPWSDVLETAEDVVHSLRRAAAALNERVYVFAHLSHVYRSGASIYVTTMFRVQPDPDQTLELWAAMKRAASESIVAHGGTISHQHGVGADHAPYLPAEKGPLGIDLLRAAIHQCDPDGILNPGKLVDPGYTYLRRGGAERAEGAPAARTS